VLHPQSLERGVFFKPPEKPRISNYVVLEPLTINLG
jgi:hypothetical protein